MWRVFSIQREVTVDDLPFRLTLDHGDWSAGWGWVEERVVGEQKHEEEQQTDQHHWKTEREYKINMCIIRAMLL